MSLLTRTLQINKAVNPLFRNQARTLASLSQVARGSAPPITILPPLPPPEFEADGSPRRYPLHYGVQEHGYYWEKWTLCPAGAFHTVYFGDLAQDFSPYAAWLGSFPVWVGAPTLIFFAIWFIQMFYEAGNVGVKPKRYTIEWVRAMKERERVENTNPVTRYLDRRYAERGYHVPLGDILPYHVNFMWMYNSHDHDYREKKGLPDLRG